MSSAAETLNRLAGAGTELAWAMAWQSTLWLGVFVLVASGLRRSSPNLRYWLWQIAAVKLLVMPLWGVLLLLPAPPHGDSSSGTERTPPSRTGDEAGPNPNDRRTIKAWNRTTDAPSSEVRGGGLENLPLDRRAWLLVGWGLAIAGQITAIAYQRELLKRRLLRTTLAADPALLARVAELGKRIGLRQPPEVRIADADGVGSPFVCGLLRSVLVLPLGMTGSLAPEALHAVLLHELAHLKRRDLLWDWIPTTARILYFFLPAAHYIANQSRLERELACDQAAMLLSGEGAARYASTLVEVVTWSSTPPTLRAALGTGTARLDDV